MDYQQEQSCSLVLNPKNAVLENDTKQEHKEGTHQFP